MMKQILIAFSFLFTAPVVTVSAQDVKPKPLRAKSANTSGKQVAEDSTHYSPVKIVRRDPGRERSNRLRDLHGNGRANEAKLYYEIDSPRGLVWDHDRLYMMHPPNLSAFIDFEGDGVADEQKTLVKNLSSRIYGLALDA